MYVFCLLQVPWYWGLKGQGDKRGLIFLKKQMFLFMGGGGWKVGPVDQGPNAPKDLISVLQCAYLYIWSSWKTKYKKLEFYCGQLCLTIVDSKRQLDSKVMPLMMFASRITRSGSSDGPCFRSSFLLLEYSLFSWVCPFAHVLLSNSWPES